MCAKSRIHGNRFSLPTQKGKTALKVVIPDHVVAALNALSPRPDVHPNYYFWSGNSKPKSLAPLVPQLRTVDLQDARLDPDGYGTASMARAGSAPGPID